MRLPLVEWIADAIRGSPSGRRTTNQIIKFVEGTHSSLSTAQKRRIGELLEREGCFKRISKPGKGIPSVWRLVGHPLGKRKLTFLPYNPEEAIQKSRLREFLTAFGWPRMANEGNG